MAISSRCFLLDAQEQTLAELLVEEEEGWFTGKVVAQDWPDAVGRALAWYDEVVSHQMLSYLDQATSAVEKLGLRVRAEDGSLHRVYALHVSRDDIVSFRTSPVPPSPRIATGSSQGSQ
jgi:hypothetical protein